MQPDPGQARLARQWLTKAERDLLAAVRTLDGDPPLGDVAMSHFHQAVEKALKAYLVWRGQPLRRTHELPSLLRECISLEAAFEPLQADAILLNPYLARFRYPGDILEPEPADVAEAQAAALRIVTVVRERLGGEPPG
jgi:HEPN domain-containing protein